MAKKIVVTHREWENKENQLKYCTELELGNILFFSAIPFSFPQEEIEFLLEQKQGKSSARKNIAYKPQLNKITNHDASDIDSSEKLREILANYSKRVTYFLSTLLPSYAHHWELDYASFRPFQEQGRNLRLRARNDLLHIDAFPTRPLHGARILRFFTNINPTESRRWVTSDSFSELAQKFGGVHGVPFPRSADSSLLSRLDKKMRQWLCKAGLHVPIRSPYDVFMLKLHNFLKENDQFQKECVKDNWEFPPNSCWVLFTDCVSHAAIAGQFALEQTYRIPIKGLLFPEKSPVSVLERLSQRNMV
jgi:hypothetical protein